MTQVDIQYELARPADEALMEAIARVKGVYGLQSVRLGAGLDSLKVTYDASRLRPGDVDRALHAAGLPARRKP